MNLNKIFLFENKLKSENIFKKINSKKSFCSKIISRNLCPFKVTSFVKKDLIISFCASLTFFVYKRQILDFCWYVYGPLFQILLNELLPLRYSSVYHCVLISWASHRWLLILLFLSLCLSSIVAWFLIFNFIFSLTMLSCAVVKK